MYPPELIPILRERIDPGHPCLTQVPDEVLMRLATTAFFAGIETYEASRYPVRVVFVGTSPVDLVPAHPGGVSTAPLYRWKILRFETPRPLAIRELVKLAVVAADDRIYSAVRLAGDTLAVTGLAREGTNFGGDPFLQMVVTRPGELSIRNGGERVLDYERGHVVPGGGNLVLSPGPVRHALEEIARSAGVEDGELWDYLHSVQRLVREMSAHGHGGILIVDTDERPSLPSDAPYLMAFDSSIATLVRLSRLLDQEGAASRGDATPGGSSSGHLLRGAFLTETERMIKEIGALTGIDGATVLNRSLALVAFGVSLPMPGTGQVQEAADPAARQLCPFDFGTFGTRHRAGAAYAGRHPGSLAFVASEDGPVSGMLRPRGGDSVIVWRV